MKTPHQPPRLYLQNQLISLEKPLAQGREGTVYALPSDPATAVKILRTDHPDPATAAAKIQHLTQNRPASTTSRNYVITWPQHPVSTTKRITKTSVAGYSMPMLDTATYHHIGSYFNPSRRRRHMDGRSRPYTYLHLILMARNLASAASALHRNGVLIADLNSRNVLATDRARVAIIDTDSFQARDPKSLQVYRCPVGTPEYTTARLQGKDFATIDRTVADDHFALAVMIYQLLFQGAHPYAGTTGDATQGPIAQRISDSLYAHAAAASPPAQVALIWKDTPFKRPFAKAFTSNAPPTAAEWAKMLTDAAYRLRQCTKDPAHWHFTTHCTWCRYKSAMHIEPFPTTTAPPSRPRSRSRRRKTTKIR